MRRILLCVLFLIVLLSAENSYLYLTGLMMDFPAGAYIFFNVGARGPEPDTTYTGTARLHIIEEIPNGSAKFITSWYPFEMDTVAELEITGTDEPGVGLTNSEAEFLIIYADDVAGELKKSISVGIQVNPAGTTAVAMGHEGAQRMPIGDEGFMIPIRVGAVDAEEKFVPEYFDPFSTDYVIMAHIIDEEVDNNSADIWFYGSEPSDSMEFTSFGGCAYFLASDTEAEVITIETVDLLGLLPPDTIAIDFVEDEGIAILCGPFDGLATTTGFHMSCMIISMLGEEPDVDDDTSEVNIEVMDITGTASAEVSPTSLTLTDGIGAFVVSDSESDSFAVFVRACVSPGNPLYSLFWAPVYFLKPGIATTLFYVGPNAFAAGDTADFTIQAVDEYATMDSAYQGYINPYIMDDDEGTTRIIDPLTGEWDWETAIPITEGEKGLRITNTTPGGFRFDCVDAEERGFFDSGFLGSSQEIEFEVLAISGSAAGRYMVFMSNELACFHTDVWHRIDIAAVDADDAVDIAYSGTVMVEATGSAEISEPSGIISIENGFGYFLINDSVQEDIALTLAGELIAPDPITLHFIEPGGGGVIAIVEEWSDKLIAAEERDLLVAVLTLEGPAASFDGTVMVSVDEPDGDDSYVCPSSIDIVAGIGTLPFSNSEPETVYIDFEAEGLVSAGSAVITYAVLHVFLSDTLALDEIHEIYMRAEDYDENVIDEIHASFAPAWEEEIYNGTFYFGPYTPSIDEGEGLFQISDTEEEAVTIYFEPIDYELLIVPDCEFDTEMGWEIGTVNFADVGIDEKVPGEFAVGNVFPNPFNSTMTFCVSMPSQGDVVIQLRDIMGHNVYNERREFDVGEHSVVISLDKVPSGVYFLRASFDERVTIQRAILIK